MANIYTIDMKYIKNKETFVTAVLGCIYREVRAVLDKEDDQARIDEMLGRFADLGKAFKTIFAFQNEPYEIMKDMYDTFEWISESSKALVNFQFLVDKFVDLFEEPIDIIVEGGFPEYKDEVLPDFRKFIKWYPL